MAPVSKNITLSQKTFVALILALVGTGGYATIGNPLDCIPNNVELAHKVELRDTVQANVNKNTLDSIGRVAGQVELLREDVKNIAQMQKDLMDTLSKVSTLARRQADRVTFDNAAFTMKGR